MSARAVATTALCLLATLATPASAGPGAPPGAGPPDWTADLPADGGSVSRPPGITELDAWLLNASGQPVYRLRQRLARRCFTRARGRRCLVRYSRRSVATGYDTTTHGARVYGWTR